MEEHAESVSNGPTIDEIVRSVQYGDFSAVQQALENFKVSPNAKDREDCSLMHWAAINNRSEIVNLLLQQNADVNIVGGNAGEIPLQWAVRQVRCIKVVALLLEHGANLHHKSIHGYDALQLAVQAGNLHVVYLLLEAGANPNSQDAWQDTPLYNLLKSDVRSTTLDTIRLLMNFQADLNHPGNDGNNALHIMANSFSFDTYCAFLICNRATKTLFEARNKDGYTPFELAWRRRNTKMIRFLFDIFMFRHFPQSLPVVIAAATFSLFFVCLHYFGWLYGLLLYCIIYLLSDTLSQSSLISESSRSSCGLAWGIIISSTTAYYVYLSNIYGGWWDLVIFTLSSIICYTLYRSMYTKPMHLVGNGEDSRKTLSRKIIEAEPLLNSEGQTIGNSFRFCSTCLIDKDLASTHCSKCNICVPNLDHHCPFVNNCVGKGNRRVFVLFTLFASIGCAVMSLLSFFVEHSHFCPIEGNQLWTIVSVQICMFQRYPALALATWIAFNSAIWIFIIFWGQVSMVASETTTFEILKRGNYGGHCISSRGFRNFIHFFSTGHYHTTRRFSDSCCSKDIESQAPLLSNV